MKKPAKVISLGQPLNTPDEELDMAALVTPEDIAAAKTDAARNMARRGAAMLEAARVETTEEE